MPVYVPPQLEMRNQNHFMHGVLPHVEPTVVSLHPPARPSKSGNILKAFFTFPAGVFLGILIGTHAQRIKDRAENHPSMYWYL